MNTEAPRIALIVNPVSAGGSTGRKWPAIEARLRTSLPSFTVLRTEFREHATQLTREALRSGHDCIVSVGGDGTHHEVLNGFYDGNMPLAPSARLAIIPNGTGSDLARTLGIGSTDEAITSLVAQQVRKVDVGRASFTRFDGTPGLRYFLNVADFGIGGAVVERVNRSGHYKGGKLAYFVAIVQTLLSYRSPQLRLQIDGEEFDERMLNVIMAKGKYYGGGIHVARDAELDNGRFEVLIINSISALTAFRYLHTFYDGSFVEIERLVRRRQATRIVASSSERVLIDLDGEAPGQLPLVVELLPSALNLVGAPR